MKTSVRLTRALLFGGLYHTLRRPPRRGQLPGNVDPARLLPRDTAAAIAAPTLRKRNIDHEITRALAACPSSQLLPLSSVGINSSRRSRCRPHLPASPPISRRRSSTLEAEASTLVDRPARRGLPQSSPCSISPTPHSRVARERLGARAANVRWVEADVRAAPLAALYAVWHDRAVFHFLTDARDRAAYVESIRAAVRPDGHVIVASFALDGPTRCSGLPVVRYSCESMYGRAGGELPPARQRS